MASTIRYIQFFLFRIVAAIITISIFLDKIITI